ncbi:MAG: TIGR01777 family protein [Methylococcales bacterium]|jgi:uncharacterized protein|nr:TIGR01777 family protein [Methylococcales bacterium]
MNILVAGGTGLIGSSLITSLSAEHKITVLTRNKKKAKHRFQSLDAIEWNSDNLKEVLNNQDLVINLVGENIGNQRWSQAVKKEIIMSRVKPAQRLCSLINELNKADRPRLFNASAIGVYGLQKTLQLQRHVFYDETSSISDKPKDFLSEVGLKWESALDQYTDLNLVKLRFAVVLTPKGGMLNKVLLPFKLGLGGKIGSGQQPFSWVAIEDVIGIIHHLIKHPEIQGPINLVAPQIVSQHQFAKQLAKRLHRPALMPMPSFVVKALFGQMGHELLLSGQSVQSKKLDDYEFKFRTLESALKHWQF